ncbi:probable myosin light chain kinase DDB_G0279831 [Schistocerca gregaria]|uniref:probable myosin light chain kinase DDB_G0279831 n=1 Tax=Schistocerca gregaria TaxID=7010 RepID=UPI00211E8397|nr:probable myosin light chain kinase DDB_G0279831 [Schistocerca gregaria]
MLNHSSLLVNSKPPPIHLNASSFQISCHQHALSNSNVPEKSFPHGSPCVVEKENLTNGSILPQQSAHLADAPGALPPSQPLAPQGKLQQRPRQMLGASHTPQTPSTSELLPNPLLEKLPRVTGQNASNPHFSTAYPGSNYGDPLYRYSTMISPTSKNPYHTPSQNSQEENGPRDRTSVQDNPVLSVNSQSSERPNHAPNSLAELSPCIYSVQTTPSSNALPKTAQPPASSEKDSMARKQALLIKALERDKFSNPQSWLAYLQFEYSRKAQPEKLISKINQFVFTKINSAEYLDDPNYLKIWLLYSHLHSSPQDRHDIYKKMQVDCIGKHLAAFYISWAKFELHHCGIERAQYILSLANEYNAQPSQALSSFHSELLRSRQLSLTSAELTPSCQKSDVYTENPCVAAPPSAVSEHGSGGKQLSPCASLTPLAPTPSSAGLAQHIPARPEHTPDPQRFTPRPPSSHAQGSLLKSSNNSSAPRRPTLKSLGSSFRGGAKRQIVAEKSSTPPLPCETPSESGTPSSEGSDLRHQDGLQHAARAADCDHNPSPDGTRPSRVAGPVPDQPPNDRANTELAERSALEDVETHKLHTQTPLHEVSSSRADHHRTHWAMERLRAPPSASEQAGLDQAQKRPCTRASEAVRTPADGEKSARCGREDGSEPAQSNNGQAPNFVDEPLSNGQAPSKFMEKPLSNGQVPSNFVDKPLYNGHVPPKFVDKPLYNGHVPPKFVDKPLSNGHVPPNFVDKPLSNGQNTNRATVASESSVGSAQRRESGEARPLVRASPDRQAEKSAGTKDNSTDSATASQKAFGSLRECWQKASALLKTSVIELKSVPYLNLGLIGKGGSSRVYRVLSPDFTILALKVVSLVDQPPEVLEQYLNEVKLLHSLRGKNRYVIELADAAVNYEKQILMVLLEYAEIDFHRLLASDPVVKQQIAKAQQNGEPALYGKLAHDIEALRYYWKSMLMAVQIIHSHRIVHGDLKPANFVIVKGQLKLIDFGIAKAINHNTSNIKREDIVGTLNYMAPEAVTPKENSQWKVSLASDVWSLGCILYQMVYGYAPFEHVKNFAKKLIAISGGDGSTIEFPKISNVHLVQIMESCLKRNPADRPTISELLQHEFFDQKLKRL